jgi:hypothetical protein
LSGPDQKGPAADEAQLMPNALIQTGALSIALNAEMMQFYSSGIMDPFFPSTECNPTSLNHAVLLVGYGSETSVIYGTVRMRFESLFA